MCELSIRKVSEIKYLFDSGLFDVAMLSSIFNVDVAVVASVLTDPTFATCTLGDNIPAHISILVNKQQKVNESNEGKRTVLTDAQKRDMKRLYALRFSQQQVADLFRVHRHTVRRLVGGETHKNAEKTTVSVGFEEYDTPRAKRLALAELFNVAPADVRPRSMDCFSIPNVGQVWIYLKGNEKLTEGMSVVHKDLVFPGFIVYK